MVHDGDLPKRLPYHQPWATFIPLSEIPPGTVDIEWLGRCQVTPDGKVIRSRPSRNVPPFGAIPRG